MNKRPKLLKIILTIIILIVGCNFYQAFHKETCDMREILLNNIKNTNNFIDNCNNISNTYAKYLAGTMSESDFIKKVNTYKKVNEEVKINYDINLKHVKLKKYDKETSFFNTLVQLSYEVNVVQNMLDKSVEDNKVKDRLILYDIYNKNMKVVKLVIVQYKIYLNDYVDRKNEKSNLSSIIK